MSRFLRHGGRHYLYWGDNGLQLNPYVTCSHMKNSKRRTWGKHEPVWLWSLRKYLFMEMNEHHRCGSRRAYEPSDVFNMATRDVPYPDRWLKMPLGERECSHCGAMHPDDFFALCKRAVDVGDVEIEPTDKGHKYYIHRPEVRNAGEGAIKFYTWHLEQKQFDADNKDNKVFRAALKITRERMQVRWNLPANGQTL